MSDFFSPIADPADWNYTVTPVTIPAGMRYAGYTVRGVVLSRANGAQIRAAAKGTVKQRDDGGGFTFLELQANPLAVRRVVGAGAGNLPGGLPTFYYRFALASAPPVPFADDESVVGDGLLHTTTAVTLAMVAQDRIMRDPALYAAQIAAAITDAGGDAGTWQPFADALNAALNTGPAAPVLILDPRGQPVQNGEFDLVYAGATHRAVMAPEDNGDLQQTVARMHAADDNAMPIANLWGSESSLRLRPASNDPEFEFQLARLEDGQHGAVELVVDPLHRHILHTNLFDWFSKQCATHEDPLQPNLERYWRGNRVRPLVNGIAFYDELFRELHDARNSQGSFRLTGWSMMPDVEYTKPRAGDPADLKVTLKEIAAAIGEAGGQCRFLPAQFLQVDPLTQIDEVEIGIVTLVVYGILIFDARGVEFVRTDTAGALILLALVIANGYVISSVLDEGGRAIEPNLAAEEELDGLNANTISRLAPYPVHVQDQLPPPDESEFPFDVIFDIVRNFGCYHQKMSVVRNSDGYIGYCGGIDLHENRLDDHRHVALSPYHDVHCRVEGPAVRDMALTFEQRWEREGSGGNSGLAVPAAASLGTPGSDIVQVARTYFQPADPVRRLPFAPQGDRTIANSMLAGIDQAKEFIYIEDQYFTPPLEYRTLLIDKVASGDIKKLIVMIPMVNDQPFGATVSAPLVAALKQADAAAGGGIVHIGFPRRHFTVPNNEVRASSGKCLLFGDLPNSSGLEDAIFLGPKSRLPVPPFWIAVDGELIYIFDESTVASPHENASAFQGLRGNDTHLMAKDKGPKTREHKAGAAATVVYFNGIYVHAKMMIVDDVFLSIGSANLNRRGLWHDGEFNIFTMPETLKAGAANPIRTLRHELWAEMLNLPHTLAAGLVDDPITAADYFTRNPLGGNRFVEVEAQVTDPFLGSFAGGDAMISTVLQALAGTVISVNHQDLFDIVIDPTTALENRIC